MTLLNAKMGKEYIVKAIDIEDEALENFLFTLGCYIGEPVTVISRLKGCITVSVKDGRYAVDNALADAISVG